MRLAKRKMGIYSRPTRSSDSLDHYFSDYSLAMPMALNLYSYNGEKDIDCIYNYSPTAPQWWITGFNPEYVGKVDVTKHVMIGSVDFSKFTDSDGKNEMYDKFEDAMNSVDNENKKQFLIYDEVNHMVWIIWYERNLV